MQKFSEFFCKNRNLVLIVSGILLILSVVGMNFTKINYDILVYLPEDIETIKGQNILSDDFHMGAFSIASIENMAPKDILKLESKIKKVDSVNEVVSLYDVVGTTIPLEMLPDEVSSKLHDDDTDLLMITFEDSTSAESTMKAVEEIRSIADDSVKLGGMSSLVLDTRELSSREIAIYIVIAVALCLLVLELSLNSYLVPVLLLLNIGCAILFNLGSNVFLGEISYITKALVAVLQLGVTTDFSIFLYHSYEKNKSLYKTRDEAMVNAIKETFVSVTGSSLTTIVGFLVLCTMSLTLGKDLGIVMAKGVLLGVVCVLTLFPSLLLVFDKSVEKTKHKQFIPKFTLIQNFVIKHYVAIFVAFLVLLVPFYLANSKVDVYYKMDESLPDTLDSIIANETLKNEFNIVSPEMIILDKTIKNDEVMKMINEVEKIDGVDFVISKSKIQNLGIDTSFVSEENMFETDKYQMVILNSTYEIASDELNSQAEEINKVIKKYDKDGILVGEGPLTKDLIETSDQDFKNVNYSSIICIFIVLFFVLRSLSLPFLLIATIEFAIFVNMGISYFGGVTLPFVAPIVLGTIQLGATIDYAILITTTYLKYRNDGYEKKKAMEETLRNSVNSIFVSGMCFFAATFGVGVYSDIDMVGSLCTLISRGAIISMIVVITVLPSILLIFDSLIIKTTLKSKGSDTMKNKSKKLAAWSMVLLVSMSVVPYPVLALTKEETVYSKHGTDGHVTEVLVNERLINDKKDDKIDDYTELEDILNINNDNSYSENNKGINWDAKGSDIFYQGKTKRDLPVDLSIEYSLDGKKMKLDDMLGKSGKAEIVLKYTNSDKHTVGGTKLYTPFTVTMGTMIDADSVSNVRIENGKVSSNGTRLVLVGIATPGLYESLGASELKGTDTIKISFETQAFELPSIYSVVVPKLVSESDLKVFDKMESLYKDTDTLKSSMDKIEDGSKALKNGSNLLKSKLEESMGSLSNSNNALNENQILGITNATAQKVKSTFTDEYKNTLAQETWAMVQKSMSVDDAKVQEIVKSSISSAVADYLNNAGEYDSYVACKTGEAKMQNGLQMDASELAACQVIKSDATLPLIERAATLASANAAKGASVYVAEKVSKEVSVSVAEQTAVTTATEVASSLAPQVANEVKTTASKTVADSLTTLYNGVSSLDAGISDLNAGISAFNKQGISKITSAVNNSLKPTIYKTRNLVKLGEKYQSFGSKLDDTNGETKFVMVVDGKKVEEKKVSKVVKQEKTTFWQKIKNLFK